MLLGNAVAAGLEFHFKDCSLDAQDVAETYVRTRYQKGSDRSLKGTVELARLGVELGMATNLSLSRVLNVEQFFGRIKPDLVGRAYDDELVVVDHKVKTNLDSRWLERELQGYDHSNQFYHYAWQVAAEYGEPVTRVLAHVIILAPVPQTLVHSVTITKEHVDFWLKGVAQDWRVMAGIEGGVQALPRFSACMGKYGLCDFDEGCHVLAGDELQFEILYDRTEGQYAG